MELQQLRYFASLSQTLHFQRAAEKSHVSQPTLSQQIKKLETELGVRLFERSPQQVALTAAGKKFLPYALAALENLEKGARETKEQSGEISGTLRVGAIPTAGPYLLPRMIPRVRKEAPRLHLELFEETTSVLIQSLKEGKIDLGILSYPIKENALVARSIGWEPFLLAVSKKHRLASQEKVSFKDLRQEKLLILQEGHCFSDQALEFCKLSRKDEQVIFQGSSLASVMRLASAGEGATLVPKMAAEPYAYPQLRFIPFAAPEPKRQMGVFWRITSPLTKAHSYLLAVIEKIFSEETL